MGRRYLLGLNIYCSINIDVVIIRGKMFQIFTGEVNVMFLVLSLLAIKREGGTPYMALKFRLKLRILL